MELGGEGGFGGRLAATVKLFELGRLSSGAAARLAGIPQVAFLSRLIDYGVDILRWTEEDFHADFGMARS